MKHTRKKTTKKQKIKSKPSFPSHYTDWPYTADVYPVSQDSIYIPYKNKQWPFPSFYRNRKKFFRQNYYYTRSVCHAQVWCYDGDPEIFLMMLYLWDSTPCCKNVGECGDCDTLYVNNEYRNVMLGRQNFYGFEHYLIHTKQIRPDWRQHPCCLPLPDNVNTNWSYFHRN